MLKAYSKINLGIDVDPTNYPNTSKHKISSLFLLYKELYDLLDITQSDIPSDCIQYFNQEHQPLFISDCLVTKTLQYLRANYLIDQFYNIKIIKSIPYRSGLGGGSSDAAEVIKFIVPNYQQLDMQSIALELGSDIPFFLSGYTSALVSGFGEIIQPVLINTNLIIKIHLNPHCFSTSEIFHDYLLNPSPISFNNYNYVIHQLNTNQIPNLLHNIFFDCCVKKSIKWKYLYDDLKTKHDFIIVTGSGGTIVSIDKPKIRTRYAPSPTGYFHIGGARTAIFNYLYAKHFGGDFIVRIEDTDVSRNVENGIESQLDNLEWLGIKVDESLRNPGPYGEYIQTAKLDRYQQLAYELLDKGLAYRCFCSEEQLEQDRNELLSQHQTPRYSRRCRHLSSQEIEHHLQNQTPFVIRLKIDDDKTFAWNDLIRDFIEVPGSAMTDPVILKSNNIPMYNFAVVVDDYDMKITHVLRGEEHISNTPYQIAIRDCLGFDNGIQYGHLSVIIDETGKKLSKRNKTTKQFIDDYKQIGFLPEAVFNFLSLLSWTSPNNQEIMTQDELINYFDIKGLSKSPTFFDFQKMLWVGNEYFKALDDSKYLDFVKPYIHIELDEFLQSNLDLLVLIFKNQISYADQLNDLIRDSFITSHDLDNEMHNILNENKDVVHAFYDEVKRSQEWSLLHVSNIIDKVKNKTGKKGKNLFMPIRIATSNLMHGPELVKVIFLKQPKNILFNIDKINLF